VSLLDACLLFSDPIQKQTNIKQKQKQNLDYFPIAYVSFKIILDAEKTTGPDTSAMTTYSKSTRLQYYKSNQVFSYSIY
jgi:hypothetical protein